MQTQCPHCDTRFRVTETQVTAADGFVRCGICHEVFNAYEVAKNNLESADKDTTEDSAEPHTESIVEEAAQVEIDLHSDDNVENAAIDSSHEPLAEPQDLPPTTEASTAETLSTDASASEDEAAESPVQEQEDNSTGTFDEVDATDPARKDAFDFFDEKITQPLPHVVPEKFKDSFSSNTPSTVSTLLWSIGILVLTATLMLQYIWYNRDQFHQIPEIQSTILALCEQLDCDNLTVRDPQKIKLISRNVYTHPKHKAALMIDLTMKNDAEFAQPFPVLQIDFSDVRGGSVAARQFLPKEYLSIEETQIRSIPPFRSIDVSLEIKDPGKQAMTYEFEFL